MNDSTARPVSAAVLLLSAATGLLGCCAEVVVDRDSNTSAGGGTTGTTGWGGSGEGGTAGAQGGGGSGGQGGACDPAWGHLLGGSASLRVRSLAVDGAGSVLTSMQYLGGLSFDGTPLADPEASGFAITKVDASGALLWSRLLGTGSNQDEPLPIAVDGLDNVVMGGSFYDTMDVGEGVQVTTPGQAALVVKLDAGGHPLWARGFSDGFSGARVASLALDGAGNVFLTGDLEGWAVDFGWGPMKGDFFLAKLDVMGNPLWAKVYTGAMLENRTLAVRAGSGAVVLAGSLYDATDFGGGVLTSAGGFDLFVLELDAAGNHVQSRRFGDEQLQRASGLALDAAGNIVLLGIFNGTPDLGGGPLTSQGGFSPFVAKLDPAGNHLWSRGLPSQGADVTGLAVRPSGEVVLTGGINGTFDAGCGPITADLPLVNGFFATFGNDGTCVSQQKLAGSDDQLVTAVALDSAGRIAMTGFFSGTIDLGGEPLVSDGADWFVAALAEPCGP